MQIKTTLRYYLTCVRIAVIKKKKMTHKTVDEDMEKREPLCTVFWSAN